MVDQTRTFASAEDLRELHERVVRGFLGGNDLYATLLDDLPEDKESANVTGEFVNPDIREENVILVCQACNVSTNSSKQLKEHMAGKKHKKMTSTCELRA